jgi:hypothetical protein
MYEELTFQSNFNKMVIFYSIKMIEKDYNETHLTGNDAEKVLST